MFGTSYFGQSYFGQEPGGVVPPTAVTVVSPAAPRVGIKVREVLGQPAQCTFVTASQPVVAEQFTIYLGPLVLFSGTVQPFDQRDEDSAVNKVWNATALDWTVQLNRRRPVGNFQNTSATTVIKWLVANDSSGFTTVNVQANLPTISILFDGTLDFVGCLSAIKALVAGSDFRVDYARDVHFWTGTDPSAVTPTTVDANNPYTQVAPSMTTSTDPTPLRNRVYVVGASVNVLSDVLPNDSVVPTASVAIFNAIVGGKARAAGQVISYAGVQVGGGGSLVGPGVAPSNSPTLALASGAGLGSGVYQYASTWVTNAGETLPSPLGTITTGFTSAPNAAPTLSTPTDTAGLDNGVHDYVVTFVTSSGETTPGPASQQKTTITFAAPSDTPVASQTSPAYGPSKLTPGSTYTYGYTFATANGETVMSPASSGIVAVSGNGIQVAISYTGLVQNGQFAATIANFYRSKDGGTYHQFATQSGSFGSPIYDIYTSDADIAGNPSPPGTGTLFFQRIPLTNIPTGDGTVTGRKLYRRFNGTGSFKLVTTLSDNTTSAYNDTKANASLGADAPSSNTATANQVAVSGIAVGPTGTTQRKVYRTVVGGSQLKLQQTIANNTATTGTQDSTPDGSLGANAPTGDTSGLTQTPGQVNAGSTSLLLAGAGPFAAGGGWATDGVQYIRYAGISTNTLTGIPASGVGSIKSSLNYGTTVTACPALSGVTGLTAGLTNGVSTFQGTVGVALWVQRDDAAAQAAQAALEQGAFPGSDGIHEFTITDPSLTSDALCQQAGDADLSLFSRPVQTVKLTTFDPNAKLGATILINQGGIYGSFRIQDVTIDVGEYAAGGQFPLRTIVASSSKFTYQDLLRNVKLANN